ncbi:unnamed protein product [Protopolystoma xenopodis]|uniref:Uncharacterized protein n=1 Tax=Protopolystoma xenopodis TaxID=117903 RepID=A0A448X715_9PLAT|nr:unnamed protein product [Protopolystoma xenopodis]
MSRYSGDISHETDCTLMLSNSAGTSAIACTNGGSSNGRSDAPSGWKFTGPGMRRQASVSNTADELLSRHGKNEDQVKSKEASEEEVDALSGRWRPELQRRVSRAELFADELALPLGWTESLVSMTADGQSISDSDDDSNIYHTGWCARTAPSHPMEKSPSLSHLVTSCGGLEYEASGPRDILYHSLNFSASTSTHTSSSSSSSTPPFSRCPSPGPVASSATVSLRPLAPPALSPIEGDEGRLLHQAREKVKRKKHKKSMALQDPDRASVLSETKP